MLYKRMKLKYKEYTLECVEDVPRTVASSWETV